MRLCCFSLEQISAAACTINLFFAKLSTGCCPFLNRWTKLTCAFAAQYYTEIMLQGQQSSTSRQWQNVLPTSASTRGLQQSLPSWQRQPPAHSSASRQRRDAPAPRPRRGPNLVFHIVEEVPSSHGSQFFEPDNLNRFWLMDACFMSCHLQMRRGNRTQLLCL